MTITTPSSESIRGISKETIWKRALMPPMNGYFELADHADRMVIIGKNPIMAKTASSPMSMSATTQPGATGIRETNAAAVATNRTGAAQKSGLSAFAGIIISFEMSLSPSPISWRIPSTLPQ